MEVQLYLSSAIPLCVLYEESLTRCLHRIPSSARWRLVRIYWFKHKRRESRSPPVYRLNCALPKAWNCPQDRPRRRIFLFSQGLCTQVSS